MSAPKAPVGVVVVSRPLFTLGMIVPTPGVLDAVSPERMRACLARHVRGDFGCVCGDDAAANRAAIDDDDRILSAYAINPAEPCEGFGANCFWIITEADRSVTTFLLPDEY